MTWNEFFIKMAELVKTKSKDRSTQVGVILVADDNNLISIGYNGFPRGVNDDIDSRHERPAKYDYTEHAERNAILNAARNGTMTYGTKMYFNSNPYPCTDCARAVIQAGVKTLIGRDVPFCSTKPVGINWTEKCKISREMLNESGTRVLVLNEDFTPKYIEGHWQGHEILELFPSSHLTLSVNTLVRYPAETKLKCFYEDLHNENL